jgi:hypothetical protein
MGVAEAGLGDEALLGMRQIPATPTSQKTCCSGCIKISGGRPQTEDIVVLLMEVVGSRDNTIVQCGRAV